MRTIISFAALFLSATLVQLGSGSLAPLDALSGSVLGFSTLQIGTLGSAHFLGFFLGCYATPRLMGAIGHSRAFAAVASLGILSALMHPVIENPHAWAIMRIGTGIAVSGGYTVIESWLQSKIQNANRGRVISVYRVVDMTGSLVAQGMIAFLDPASYVSYNIVAMLCCLCLLPLTLTLRQAPTVPKLPRLRPFKTIRMSPLGAAGVVVVGLTGSSFRMVGPIFGEKYGLDAQQIALFLASAVLGGALAQLPIGWLADKFDRRHVLIGVSAMTCLVCAPVAAGLPLLQGSGIFIFAFAFGAFSFPLYSVSSAHANDLTEPDFVVELNASLIMLFAVGAIVSPVFAALLIDQFGPPSLFAYVAVAHVVLIVFGIYRMTRRPGAAEKTPYSYIPRTSFIFSRLLRRRKNGGQ
jgi:MFS family permease